MTFHQSPSNSSSDTVVYDSYDDRYYDFQFPQHYSFPTYLPDLRQHAYPNYRSSDGNVPNSSILADACHQFPYANQMVVSNRFGSDEWANRNLGQMNFLSPPDSSSYLFNNSIYDCCNMPPNPAYSTDFMQLPDCKYLGNYRAGLNLQSSGGAFVSGSYTAQARMQNCQQYPAYSCQHREIETGCYSTAPWNYAVNSTVQDGLASLAELRTDDRNMLGIHSTLLYDGNIQQPTFSHFPAPKQQAVVGQSFEAERRVDTFSQSNVVDYPVGDTCVNNFEVARHQNPVEISSFLDTGRLLPDCAMNDGNGCIGHAGSQSSAAVSETQISHSGTVSATVSQLLCQATPEISQSGKQPVTFTSSVSMSDRRSNGAEPTSCGVLSSQYSIFPRQNIMDMSVGDISTSCGSEIPVKESEQIDVSVVEPSVSCETLAVVNIAGTSTNSSTTQLGDWQLQADSTRKVGNISRIGLAPTVPAEVNSVNKCAAGGREIVPRELMETTDSHASIHDSDNESNSSDDVIVLSPPPAAEEPIASVARNPVNHAMRSHCSLTQAPCVFRHASADHQMHSRFHPFVPESTAGRSPYINSRTVGVSYCRSPSMPTASHDFAKSGNHDMFMNRAKHIASHNCCMQTTCCEKHLSHSAISRIPTRCMTNCLDIRQPSVNVTSCSSVKRMSCRPPITVGCDPLQEGCVHYAQRELPGRLHLPQSSLQDEVSERRAYNSIVGHSDCCNMLKTNRDMRLSHPMLPLSPASSKSFVHCGITQDSAHKRAPSLSQNVGCVPSSQISDASAGLRTNPNGAQLRKYGEHTLPFYWRGSSALQHKSQPMRRSGMYSVEAGRLMLQRLKQAKLSDFMSARAARQQLFNRRLGQCSDEVIDLTGDDHDEEAKKEMCNVRQACQVMLTKLDQLVVRSGATRVETLQSGVRLLPITPRNYAGDAFWKLRPPDRDSLSVAWNVADTYRREKITDVEVKMAECDGGDGDRMETCETIFARTLQRAASMQHLRRPWYGFFRRRSLVDGSCCSLKEHRPKQTYAVDRSLPFYRCFVEDLLKIYRFCSYGQPRRILAKLWPPSSASGSQCARLSTHSGTHAESVKDRKPVVKLMQLDQSVVKSGTAKVESSESGICMLPVSQNSAPNLASSASSDASQILQSVDSRDIGATSPSRVDTYREEKVTKFDLTKKEDATAKVAANDVLHDDVILLCRPVSVLLERLDQTKIYQICKKLRKTDHSCQRNRRKITRLRNELAAGDVCWTVTQKPRADKLPVLIIHLSPVSGWNSSQKKLTKSMSAFRVRHLRNCNSKYVRTSNRIDAIRHLRKSAPKPSKSNTSQKRIPKKVSELRKLGATTSVLMSMRSRSFFSRILRPRVSKPVTSPLHQKTSSKCSLKQLESLSEASVKRAEIVKKILWKESNRLHAPEGQGVRLIPLPSFIKNALPADPVQRDSTCKEDLPEVLGSSDSSAVDQSLHSSANVVANDYQNLHSSAPDSTADGALSADLWTHDSVVNERLPEDCDSLDSNTVLLSPPSSVSDSTIAYRSPLMPDAFESDEPSLSPQETFGGTSKPSFQKT